MKWKETLRMTELLPHIHKKFITDVLISAFWFDSIIFNEKSSKLVQMFPRVNHDAKQTMTLMSILNWWLELLKSGMKQTMGVGFLCMILLD